MRRTRVRNGLAATITALLIAAPLPAAAWAAPDHEITLTEAEPEQSWDGAPAAGTNQSYNPGTGEPCPEAPSASQYCEQTLIWVDTPYFVDIEVELGLDAVNDFDLFIYHSDASANRGELIDSSAFFSTIGEVVTAEGAQGYYLVQVVYYLTAGSYSATAKITGKTQRLLLVDRRSGSGTVRATGIECGEDCSESYDQGATVEVAAVPAEGSRFVSWGGDCSGAGPTCTVKMDGDRIVHAAFGPTGGSKGSTACGEAEGNHIVGTPNDDVLRGTPAVDVLCGLDGNDRLRGAEGNDILIGGPGDDRLIGGPGHDRCLGGPGRDMVRGCEK